MTNLYSYITAPGSASIWDNNRKIQAQIKTRIDERIDLWHRALYFQRFRKRKVYSNPSMYYITYVVKHFLYHLIIII